LCRLKDIRAGINAFTLIEKELKETNIPLYEYHIPKDEGDGVVLKKELYI